MVALPILNRKYGIKGLDMDSESKKWKHPSPVITFPAYYLIACGAWGTVNTYWPVYYKSFGYSNTQIGVLSSVGPFAAMFGLLFWGARADRARYRNNVLLLICVILCVMSQLYLLNDSFVYTFALSIVFMFSFYSMNPVADSLALEHAQKGTVDYGKSRMWGSIGLGLIPLLPGLAISRWGILSIFPAFSILMLMVIAVTSLLPKMAGAQCAKGLQNHGKKRSSLLSLRSDKELVYLVVFLFLAHMTLGFYYAFFPVHMVNLGAADLIGLNNLAQFAVEFLLMFFLTGITRRFGFAKLFSFAFALTAVRMLFIGLVSSPALLIVVNLFGGLGYSLCMSQFSIFVLRTPEELRTSVQMLNTIVAHSLSRFFGSMLGGALSDIIGIPSVFICAGILDLLLLVLFIAWVRKKGAMRGQVLV